MPNKDGTDHILGKEENMKYSAAHYVKMQAALLWYIGYKMTKKNCTVMHIQHSRTELTQHKFNYEHENIAHF